MRSMTGYASATGQTGALDWTWEIRSVNAKGLDLRLRLPEGYEALDPVARKSIAGALMRGAVTANLRVGRTGGDTGQSVDQARLAEVLTALSQITDAAKTAGLPLGPTSAAQIMGLRGVISSTEGVGLDPATAQAIGADLGLALDALCDMRRDEGQRLQQIMADILDQIAQLITQADAAAAARQTGLAARLDAQVRQVLDRVDGLDPDRMMQELAVVALRTDVTEELDRLRSHVVAARDLLVADGPVGRKLDFLAQEFNREANTLCSKSQDQALTRVGLALKTAIEQLREQIQNVE